MYVAFNIRAYFWHITRYIVVYNLSVCQLMSLLLILTCVHISVPKSQNDITFYVLGVCVCAFFHSNAKFGEILGRILKIYEHHHFEIFFHSFIIIFEREKQGNVCLYVRQTFVTVLPHILGIALCVCMYVSCDILVCCISRDGDKIKCFDVRLKWSSLWER